MTKITGFVTGHTSIVNKGDTVIFFGLVSEKPRYMEDQPKVYKAVFIQQRKEDSFVGAPSISPTWTSGIGSLALELASLKDGVEVEVEVDSDEIPSTGTELDFSKQLPITAVKKVVQKDPFGLL